MNYTKTEWKDGVYQYPNRYSIDDNGDGTSTIIREVGTVTQQQTDVIADLMNNIESGISYSDDGSMYKNITGTANSMLCELNESVLQGQIVRFIAIGDTGGNNVTLNGISIYRVNSTTPPNIKKGEKVILCYNQSNNCWLYQHSAEGDVTSNQVLSGYTYSNKDGLNLSGTMINRGNINYKLTSTTDSFIIPSGYITGGQIQTPTLSDLTTQSNVTNSSQILSGYRGYSNGNLYNGNLTYDKLVLSGNVIISNEGVAEIPNVVGNVKFGVFVLQYYAQHTVNGYDSLLSLIYDPTGNMIKYIGETNNSTISNATCFTLFSREKSTGIDAYGRYSTYYDNRVSKNGNTVRVELSNDNYMRNRKLSYVLFVDRI